VRRKHWIRSSWLGCFEKWKWSFGLYCISYNDDMRAKLYMTYLSGTCLWIRRYGKINKGARV
jgi:hypothetical protein